MVNIAKSFSTDVVNCVMSDVLHQYSVTVNRVVDGDTLDVDVDLGFNVVLKRKRVRITGIDTPELRTEEGRKARTFVIDWVFYKKQSTAPFILRVEAHKEDKYGRILGTLWCNGEDLAQQLVLKGYAVTYDGKNPKGDKMLLPPDNGE